MTQQKNPHGLVRRKPNLDGAATAMKAARESANGTLDVIRSAFERESTLGKGDASARSEDSRRAPALTNPNQVHS